MFTRWIHLTVLYGGHTGQDAAQITQSDWESWLWPGWGISICASHHRAVQPLH